MRATSFAGARQLAELRHNTRLVMRRHRQIRWTPMAEPVVIPEWRKRSLARDMTGIGWSEGVMRALWGDR